MKFYSPLIQAFLIVPTFILCSSVLAHSQTTPVRTTVVAKLRLILATTVQVSAEVDPLGGNGSFNASQFTIDHRNGDIIIPPSGSFMDVLPFFYGVSELRTSLQYSAGLGAIGVSLVSTAGKVVSGGYCVDISGGPSRLCYLDHQISRIYKDAAGNPVRKTVTGDYYLKTYYSNGTSTQHLIKLRAGS